MAAKRAIHLAMRYPAKNQEVEEILVKFARDMKEKINTVRFFILTERSCSEKQYK